MTLRDQVEQAYEQSEYEAEVATAALDALQPLVEAAGDVATLVLCQLTRIHIRRYEGVDLEQTRLDVQEQLARAVALGDTRLQGQAQRILCLVYIHEGQKELGLAHALIAARLAAASGDSFTQAEVEAHSALLFLAKNDLPTAIFYMKRAARSVMAWGDDRTSQAIIAFNLAHLYVLTEDWAEARPLLDGARAVIEPKLATDFAYWSRLYGRVCAAEAAVALGQGDFDAAEAWVARGEEVNRADPAVTSLLVQVRLGRVLACVRLRQGRPTEATALLTPLMTLLHTTATQETALDIERRLVYQALQAAHRPRPGPQ